MNFLAPERLWLLGLVPLLAIGYIVLQRRRAPYAVRFTNLELLESVAPRSPGWRRHLPALTFLISVGILVVGFAQPTRETEVVREHAVVVLALDVSLSMEAEDVEPNRLAAAKEAATEFITTLPETIDLALVSFSGQARVVVSPTEDHTQVAAAVQFLDVSESTAIGEAIFAGLDAIGSIPLDSGEEAPPAAIVVMSDGETTVGRPDAQAVAAASEAGVAVSTIAFGTANGMIVVPGEPTPIPVPVAEAPLALIAEQTGGRAFTASSLEELRNVYNDIGTVVGFDVEEQDISPWFVGTGLVGLMITAAFSLAWFSRLP
ncbi:MAG: VWA domain-containing protein [Actinomycetia bacterium]|nr:VWA domain-containing protein [Actinomycetes bacterium]